MQRRVSLIRTTVLMTFLAGVPLATYGYTPPKEDRVGMERARKLLDRAQEGSLLGKSDLREMVRLARSKDADVRLRAVTALSYVGEPYNRKARSVVRQRLRDSKGPVRTAALVGLTRLQDPHALAAAHKMLVDRDAYVRRAAQDIIAHGGRPPQR